MALDSLRLSQLMNYNSLVDYKIRLGETISKFDYVYVNNKAKKQLGTFKVALRELEGILDNITKLIELDNMFVKIMPFEPFQKELEQNKEAAKAIKNINEVRRDVSSELKKLQEQFFKQMEYCLKLNGKVEDKIPYSNDKDSERQEYRRKAEEFETIARHSLMSKSKVPFEQEKMSITDRNEKKREHDEKSAKIDEIYSFEKEHEDTLEQALNALAITLNTPATYSEKQNLDLQKEIRKEVAEIKKALPPKVIAISSEALDKLRASDQLTLDLETIQSLLQNPTLTGKKYWKFNDRIDEIKVLLDQALKVERERKQNIQEERDTIEKKKEYATSAVKTYDDILTSNQRLQQDQIQIRNGEYGLQSENERLKADERKAMEEAHSIESKDERYQEWNDGLKVDQLYERARNDRQAVKENEAIMADKMAESAVATLPPEYTEMKKRLQSMSSLYQMQNIQSQELSGGMSR